MNTKSIIIVGAGPGVAMGIAEKFGKEGYSIGLISRTEEKLKVLKNELSTKGIHAEYANADAGNVQELRTAIQSLRKVLPAIQVVNYNAVVSRQLNVLDNPPEELLNDLNVGIVGAVTAVQELRNDLKANNGAVLLTGGGFADYPMVSFGSVSLAKAGIKNLTKQLHSELKGEGIYVGSVSVNGMVSEKEEKHNPTNIGAQFWQLAESRAELIRNF